MYVRAERLYLILELQCLDASAKHASLYMQGLTLTWQPNYNTRFL